ncbi:MAG: tRNA (adenosine(37)-N6)-threonylcarbamoyltransferase complex ATPase subunit type 1 TsaE [Spirochaetota bacterium]
MQEPPLELIIAAHDSESLQRAVKTLAGHLHPPMLVRVVGDLGAGKTTLVAALLSYWQGEAATSPTFNLRNDYPLANFRVIHLDLYRLKPSDDAYDLLPPDEDYADAVVFVEWPDKGPRHLFAPFNRQAELRLDVQADESRHVTWRSL